MNVENYLKKLESNCLLLYVLSTPPPEMSNFYWKNDDDNKFKAFIPTPNRIVYYNLEEYNRFMTISEIDNNGWKSTNKCVLLAVSNIYTEDQPFIKQMESLIVNLPTWNRQNPEFREDVTGSCDAQNKPFNTIRHYVITKYLVNKIEKVPVEKRGRYAEFKDTLTITLNHDNAEIIDAMNFAFELAAKRFVDDSNCKVYSYPTFNN